MVDQGAATECGVGVRGGKAPALQLQLVAPHMQILVAEQRAKLLRQHRALRHQSNQLLRAHGHRDPEAPTRVRSSPCLPTVQCREHGAVPTRSSCPTTW